MNKMADVEARREARRRKILENSEKRMKILLNQTNDEESKSSNNDTEEISTESPSPVSESPCTVESTVENKSEKCLPGQQTNVIASPEVSDTSAQSSPTVRQRGPKNTVKIDQSITERPAISRKSEKISNEDLQPQTHKLPPQQHLELLRIVSCVFVAILSRMILKLGFGLLYFQSIMVQFLAVEAALFYYKRNYLQNVRLPHRGSVMSGALMLCGIKPDVINVYNTIMGYITAVMEDVSLYIFAFVTCHLLVAN